VSTIKGHYPALKSFQRNAGIMRGNFGKREDKEGGSHIVFPAGGEGMIRKAIIPAF